MVIFPVEPKFSKIIISSKSMGCTKQLSDLCSKANIPLVSSNNNTEVIRKCLTTGLVFNTAFLQKDGTYKTKLTKNEVYIHPSSCLFGSKPENKMSSILMYFSLTLCSWQRGDERLGSEVSRRLISLAKDTVSTESRHFVGHQWLCLSVAVIRCEISCVASA
ncbi:unnamed protein product [Oppiella nova]|uniref:DEAD-box helicase OB fold domain-containing protein n=1 Tax=Oppiella nova TaxID=334625 RepID=A0A7R9LJG0_9ACAR|nr:unnamed protein product [Oppiella nova]CAG2164242.1 unnamed protein product [Oppiella nova]